MYYNYLFIILTFIFIIIKFLVFLVYLIFDFKNNFYNYFKDINNINIKMYYNYLFIILTFMFIFNKIFSIDTIIYSKYNRYKTIIKFIPKKQVFNISKLFIGVVVTTMYYNMLNFLFNNVKKIKFNTYVVTYTINGKLYKFVAKPTRGPSRVVQISNEMQLDVTDEILPYMGPNYDWYGTKLNPTFFNYTTLVFEFSNGLEYVCKGNESLLDTVQHMNKRNIN